MTKVIAFIMITRTIYEVEIHIGTTSVFRVSKVTTVIISFSEKLLTT